MRTRLWIIVFATVAAGVALWLTNAPTQRTPTSAPTTSASSQAARPAKWAQPMSRPGLQNFYKVSDTLYRGAQPDEQGFAELEKLGVKTDVNLRMTAGDWWNTRGRSIRRVRIWSNPLHPEDEDVVEFLKVATDPARRPVFVHCRHGADRTGTMIAIYRIVVQGWSKQDALDEMRHGGYGFHEAYFGNLIQYIEQLDVEKIKKAAGL